LTFLNDEAARGKGLRSHASIQLDCFENEDPAGTVSGGLRNRPHLCPGVLNPSECCLRSILYFRESSCVAIDSSDAQMTTQREAVIVARLWGESGWAWANGQVDYAALPFCWRLSP
jgi:hypothetical protein